MALSIIVTAGHVFVAGVPITLAALRKAALPSISISAAVGTSDITPGAITAALLRPDAVYYGLDRGTVNAAAVALNPAVTAYVDGLLVAFKVANANTGAATLAANGLAAAPVKKNGDLDLAPSDWKAGQIVTVRYQLDANIVPPAAVYSGAGSYVLPVVAGKTYQWVKNGSDTNLVVDGATTLVATGSFTATTTTVTLNGTASAVITATVTPDSNVWQMLSQVGNPNILYPFQPASAYLGGEQGLVPRPGVGMQGYYLRADGTWVDVLTASVAANAALNTYTEIFKAGNFI